MDVLGWGGLPCRESRFLCHYTIVFLYVMMERASRGQSPIIIGDGLFVSMSKIPALLLGGF